MKTQSKSHRVIRQRGFTLVEVLVASAVFTVVIVAALLLYDRSNQVFKQSSESIDLQQNSRVAFDKLVADLRMAGFDFDRDGIPTGAVARSWVTATNYNPGDIVLPSTANGHQYVCIQGGQSGPSEPAWPTTLNGTVTETAPGTARWQENSGINVYQQPDEQVEYAGQTAITIRGNFDYDARDPNDAFNGRETHYENARFPVVTTGNDEIVTYALVSDKGPNSDTITFYADMNASGTPSRTAYPGGNAERQIDITGVDLSNTHPPYTLYRFSFDDSATLVRTPVASNIRSLRFKYFEDTTGDTPLKDLQTTPADVSNGIGGAGPYDPATPEAVVTDRLIRAKIRSLQVELIGMNPNVERGYVDNLPPWNATTTADRDTVSPNTRKVKLTTLIVPRNFGKRGLREQATTEPGAPRVGDICVGYCGTVKLTWDAPSTGGVTSYAIAWDTPISGSCTTPTFVNTIQVGPVTSGFVYGLIPDQPYCFKVMAINDYGASSSAPSGPFTPLNRMTPGAPGNGTIAATGTTVATQLPNKIQVTWQASTAYASPDQLSCSVSGSQTGSVASGESIRYNIWRGTTSTVNTAGTPYVSYTANGSAVVVNNATGLVTFTDTSVSPCLDYYYKVQAVKELCEPNAAYNVSPAVAHSAIVPATAVKGSASASGNAPNTPADLVVESTSVCNLGSCTVNLSWPKVVSDTANGALVVDSYEISRTQKLNTTITTAASSPTTTIGSNVTPTAYFGTQTLSGGTLNGWSGTGSGTVNYTDTVPEADAGAGNVSYSYEYKVRALVCSIPGAYSVIRTFPCPFNGGAVSVGVSAAFQGNGTIADPYYVNAPLTITASTASSVSSAHALLYAYSGGNYTLVRDLNTNIGPLTTTSFAAGTMTVGTTYLAEVTFTDTNGCTRRGRVYFLDEGLSCCLQNLTTSSSVISFTAGTSKFVDVFARNICTNDLTVQGNGIVFTWSSTGLTGSPAPKLDKVEYPTTATTGTNVAPCSWNSAIKCYSYDPRPNQNAGTFTVPTTLAAGVAQPSVIPLSSTSFRVRVWWTQNLAKQPITNFSVDYRRTGDTSTTTCATVP